MANFKNPLDDFRTYSYYHILVICSNTTVAESLMDSSSILESGVRSHQSFEDKFKPKALLNGGKSIDYTSELKGNANILGKYVVIYDGSSDAEFNITRVKWVNQLYPASHSEAYTTIALDGQIEIEEPRGARFMDIINKSMKAIGVDVSGVCFMLKTVFVGDKGIAITSVPPLIFLMYDIQAVFDIVGSTYNINFVGLTNGAAKMKQYNQAPQSLSSFKIKQNSTLAEALDLFGAKINELYDGIFRKYVADAKIPINEVFDKFKYIVYIIDYDDVYNDGNKYKMDQFKDQNQTTINDDATISFGDSATIESALNMIMKHCGGVLEDGQKVVKQSEDDASNAKGESSKKTDVRFGFKITTSITSDETLIFVKYHITRYKLPTTSIIELAQSGDEESEALKNNTLMFDYIWTGKNNDVLEFEMRMAMGLSFLQIMQTTENLPVDDASKNVSSEEQSFVESKYKNILGGDTKTIVYFPRANDKKEILNVKDASKALEFNELLSRFASIEALDAKLTIRGNPIFLSNMTKLPSTVGDPPIKKDGEMIKKEFANSDRVPPLCKVRIKMPKPDQAFRGNDQGIGSYDDFWYKGYYYIYSIENIFDGTGDFKQVLDIMSLPQDLNSLISDGKKETPTKPPQPEASTSNDAGNLSVNSFLNQNIGICKKE